MVRNVIIILLAIAFAGCAHYRAEDTAASKTVSELTELEEAPAVSDLYFIDHSGTSRKITALNAARILESALGTYNGVATANLKTSATKWSATCELTDGTGEIDDGTQCTFRVPFKHDLTKVILTTRETSGSIIVDVRVDEAGATSGITEVADADSLFDTASEPTIGNAGSDRYVEATSFDSGEASDIAAGSWYTINTDACATITKAFVTVEGTKKD